jgi:hypothetical protein
VASGKSVPGHERGLEFCPVIVAAAAVLVQAVATADTAVSLFAHDTECALQRPAAHRPSLGFLDQSNIGRASL